MRAYLFMVVSDIDIAMLVLVVGKDLIRGCRVLLFAVAATQLGFGTSSHIECMRSSGVVVAWWWRGV